MKRFIVLLFIITISPQAFALIELSGEYGYKRQVYGSNRQNDQVTKNYSGSMAFYFLSLTAIEFNYYNSDDIISENNTVPTTVSNINLIATQQRINNYSYGIGIRQAFASKKAFIRPTISLGYARQFSSAQSDYTYKDTTTGATAKITDDFYKTRSDSVFGTFALQFKLTKTLSLRGSVNTIFRAFEWNEARNNLKYMLGFTWYL